MFAPILAEAQDVGPTGLIVLGVIAFLVAALFGVAVFNERLRALMPWDVPGRTPRLSPAGAGLWALSAFSFAVMFFAQALQWLGVSRFAFWLVAISMFVAIGVAMRDYSRDRERI